MNETEPLAMQLRRQLRQHFKVALWFSVAFNLLLLVQPLYMLQIYDRVLTSGSLETLLLLSLLALALLAIFAFADAGRRRIFALIGQQLGATLEAPVFRAGMDAKRSGGKLETAVTDMGRVQNLFSAGTIQPFFDAPFVPMFVALVFFIHPLLGLITLGGAIFLIGLAFLAERAAKPLVELAGSQDRSASSYIAGIARQFSAIAAMGMGPAVQRRWHGLRSLSVAQGLEASRVANRYGAVSRSVRQALQVIMLGVAAWLVLRQEISAGAIIASSILSGRALAPIDQTIGGWKPLMQARRSFAALESLLQTISAPAPALRLPRPEAHLVIARLDAGPPQREAPLIEGLTLEVHPGTILLVVGPSGRGKTSLLQTIAGVWTPKDGSVRLGSIDMHDWAAEDRGPHIGYLPQAIELLPGTVRENIQRFQPVAADPRADAPHADAPLFAATRTLGVHEAILQLENGYETSSSGTAHLSAGQRQMIGLARAAYAEPVLLLLDEPSAHLDAQATTNLINFLRGWKASGRIAVIASHDLRLLTITDHVLEIDSHQTRLQPRDAFFKAISANTVRKVAP